MISDPQQLDKICPTLQERRTMLRPVCSRANNSHPVLDCTSMLESRTPTGNRRLVSWLNVWSQFSSDCEIRMVENFAVNVQIPVRPTRQSDDPNDTGQAINNFFEHSSVPFDDTVPTFRHHDLRNSKTTCRTKTFFRCRSKSKSHH